MGDAGAFGGHWLRDSSTLEIVLEYFHAAKRQSFSKEQNCLLLSIFRVYGAKSGGKNMSLTVNFTLELV